jgi:hypothetical protein
MANTEKRLPAKKEALAGFAPASGVPGELRCSIPLGEVSQFLGSACALIDYSDAVSLKEGYYGERLA